MKKLIAALAVGALLVSDTVSLAEVRFYPSGNGKSIIDVEVPGEAGGVHELFEKLRSAPFGEDVIPAVPEDARLTSALLAGNVLELCVEGSSAGIKALNAECIARTMMHNTPAECVNIIANGRFLVRYAKENGCIVYYPEKSGRYVIPELVSGKEEASLEELLELLNSAKDDGLAPIPGEAAGIAVTYAFEADGRRSAKLDFPMSVFTELEKSDETRWQFLACTALTLLSNLRDIDCVKVSFAGQNVTAVPDREGKLMKLQDGCIDRGTLSAYIGFEAAEGCFVGAADSYNPGAVLAAVMPGMLSASDVTGFGVSDGVMEISLSRRFYAAAQGISQEEERKLVYDIVNTLCRSMNVKKVRILIEDESVSTLAGSICLEGALMPSG